MDAFNEIEDLFIPGAFDEESRIDILVDTKKRLLDDQKSFKCTVSTNLDSNKYMEEAELDLSIFELTDLQKLVYEAALKELEEKGGLYHDRTRTYRYDNYENIY